MVPAQALDPTSLPGTSNTGNTNPHLTIPHSFQFLKPKHSQIPSSKAFHRNETTFHVPITTLDQTTSAPTWTHAVASYWSHPTSNHSLEGSQCDFWNAFYHVLLSLESLSELPLYPEALQCSTPTCHSVPQPHSSNRASPFCFRTFIPAVLLLGLPFPWPMTTSICLFRSQQKCSLLGLSLGPHHHISLPTPLEHLSSSIVIFCSIAYRFTVLPPGPKG